MKNKNKVDNLKLFMWFRYLGRGLKSHKDVKKALWPPMVKNAVFQINLRGIKSPILRKMC